MIRLHALILCLLYPLVALADVVLNTTKDRVYYHVELSLSKEDFRLTHPVEFYNPRWPESSSGPCKLSKSGHFDIYVSKEVFPIDAPKCKSDWMKVTMSGSSDSKEGIKSKRSLWEALKSVDQSESESIDVVIELNPYVEVISESPLKLKMRYCNAFFRTAWGKYIDHTGPID